jgi:iron complex outermembrane receptor protein
VTFGQETPGDLFGFAFTHSFGGGLTNAQSSFIEELQFQGHPGDGRFVWQAGLYLEHNDPLGFSGVQTASFTPCQDITTFNCRPSTPGFSAGTGSFSINKARFRDYAIYGQATYDLTEQLKLTAGLRYTWDEMKVRLHNFTKTFRGTQPPLFRCSNLTAADYTGLAVSPFGPQDRFTRCRQDLVQKTSAPTWLVGLDFKPIEDVLLYAKWSRGYRQGGLAIFAADPLQKYDAEKVDTYEVGAKADWSGAVPGNIAVAGFYNDFRNQQLQFGLSCLTAAPPGRQLLRPFTFACSGNTATVNAGKSELYGFEAELSLRPFEGLRIDASYGYLKSKLKSIETPEVPIPYNFATPPELGTIVNTQPHTLVVQANYTLPLAESIGAIPIGGT